jgi:tetratricopeptide (TPR) repeat protein
MPDVLYLKMKILDAQNDSEDVVEIGKKWIKKYAYSPKLPAVLLLIAKNYSKMGFVSDASYYYNRLITEYPNTKYAYLAMIYLADQLYMLGEEKKALELYRKALYSTTNIDIASLAALRLATRYMNNGNVKKAIEYYEKIYRANKQFLLRDKQKAFELAKSLASHGVYKLAVKIGGDLLKKLNKLNDLYEPLLYDLAVWSYKAKEYKKALYYVNKYIKTFPYGDYIDEIRSLRDKILFEVPKGSLKAQLENINKILKNYTGKIAQEALVRKAEILFKMKKYAQIIKMLPKLKKLPKDIFPNKKSFINKVLKTYTMELLNKKECLKATRIIDEYSVVLPKKYDDKIYFCAMNAHDYKLASLVCNKYLDSPNDKIFIKWIKRKIDALYAMGDYQGVVTAVGDLCSATKKGCYPYLLKEFFSLWHLKEYKKAIALSIKLSKYKDIRNTDAFIKIVDYAVKHNNKLLAAEYAKKIIDLQDYFKAYPYTPYVDFIFAQYTKNKKAAIKDLLHILPMLKGENLARAYFMLANLTGEKKYLLKCVKVKNSKLWKGLCKDALSLF